LNGSVIRARKRPPEKSGPFFFTGLKPEVRLNQTEACLTVTPIRHESDLDKAEDYHRPCGGFRHSTNTVLGSKASHDRPVARLLGLNAKMRAAASNPSALFVSTLAAGVHVVPLVLVSVNDNDVAERVKPSKPDFTKRSQSFKLTYMTRSTKRPQWIKKYGSKKPRAAEVRALLPRSCCGLA
jgi:hypothetical protein